VVSASRERERDLMVSMRVADGGITSTTGKDGDFVVVSGLSVLTAARWRENHASFFHPFLHRGVDIIRYRERGRDLIRDDCFGPPIILAFHSSTRIRRFLVG